MNGSTSKPNKKNTIAFMVLYFIFLCFCFAVSRVGEGAFLLGKEGGAEEEECGGFVHLL